MIYHNGTDDLHGIEEAIRATVADLRPYCKEFDSIIVSGMSGVVVGITVGLRLRKPVVIARKESDACHARRGSLINRIKLGTRALFLDDFISEGTTLEHCRRKVEECGAKLVASYEYKYYRYARPARSGHPAPDPGF